MRFNRLGAFTLGVVITAVSVGAVSFVNAAGEKQLKACANKTTGVMRYISKGSCKKTETSLSWNQMGPTGLPGSAGTNGSPGAKGDTGPAGTNGTNGQNLFVVDSAGKVLGQYLTHDANGFEFFSSGRRWTASPYQYGFINNYSNVWYYSDSQCTERLISVRRNHLVLPNATFIEDNQNLDSGLDGSLQKAFIPSDTVRRTASSFTNLHRGGVGTTCIAVDSVNKIELDSSNRLVVATEIPMLTYTAPLTIVAK